MADKKKEKCFQQFCLAKFQKANVQNNNHDHFTENDKESARDKNYW